MIREDILKLTRKVYNGLEALKEEHEAILHQLNIGNNDKDIIKEKEFIINEQLENINIGLEDAQVS